MYGTGANAVGGSGFSFTAGSSLIANILDSALSRTSGGQPGNSGNMFEAREVRKTRGRPRARKPGGATAPTATTSLSRPKQQHDSDQLNEALARIVDSQNNRSTAAGPSSYERIGSNLMELHARRARDACLSSPWGQVPLAGADPHDLGLSSVTQLLHAFRRTCQPTVSAAGPNAFTVHRFLRFCARQHERPPGALKQLLAVCQAVSAAQESIAFDQEEHVYYHVDDVAIGALREPYAMSVTKSLDLLFGEFDADSVARRIIQSQRWKSNALYKELAFDMAGRQRTEGEVIAMLKKRWNDSRDKGTELHAYIQSLTSEDQETSTSRFSVCRTADRQRSPAPAAPRATATNSEEQSIADAQMNVVEENADSVRQRVDELWIELRAQAATSDVDVRASATVGRLSSQLAARIDPPNLAAFDCFNRRRLDDGWLLLASEYIVYDRSASLAGSIDAIYVPYVEQPNLVVLVDWKRCDIDLGTRYSPFIPGMRNTNAYSMRYPKCNYWKYAMQLNVYRELLERLTAGRLLVIDMLIVSLPPDVHEPRVFSVPRLSDAQLFVADVRSIATAVSSSSSSSSSPPLR